MPFYESGSIKYYRFPSLEHEAVYHAVFTRHGGFSPIPWHSLNFGASVGDDLTRVNQNRSKALRSINIKPESVFDLYQVHSSSVVITDRPLFEGEVHQKADAILTQRPNVTLMMRFADCVPILFFDSIHRVIGIAHAGWIGTVDRIASKTIEKMIDNFGSSPSDIIAAIGPSIGPDHYSVGKEVLERIHSTFASDSDQLITNFQGKSYFDLWKANELLLTKAGVKKIETAGICTGCNQKDWFSHRGEHGKTGRFGVILGLSS